MQNPPTLLAIDQGTTSSRAILFDANSRILGMAQQEFRQSYPQPGWVEQDPMEIWSSQYAVIAEVLAKTGMDSANIAAIGLTNQRETTLVWERDSGKPVYPAIVWQDRRTADHCETLKEDGTEAWISAKTGLRLDPYFSATKIRWILDNVAGAMQRARDGKLAFGTVDCWLLWQLSGGKLHQTDISNASRTLLMNLHTGDWDNELLELFGIPCPMLPQIRPSCGRFGAVSRQLTPAGVTIHGIAGDQQAALFGQACFSPGMAKSTYGTGCFMLMNTGDKPVFSNNHLLTTVAWQRNGITEYALEGSVFVAGALFQWLRDELRIVGNVAELDALAQSVTDSGGVVLVPAFAGLGAPHWDPRARALMIGMTRGTNRAHICRAAIEAVAHQCADLLDCMENDFGGPLAQLRVDGGGAKSHPLLQFQADLLGKSVIRPLHTETTALGAAYLAGLSAGVWQDTHAIAASWQADTVFSPQLQAHKTVQLRTTWQRATRLCKGWAQADA